MRSLPVVIAVLCLPLVARGAAPTTTAPAAKGPPRFWSPERNAIVEDTYWVAVPKNYPDPTRRAAVSPQSGGLASFMMRSPAKASTTDATDSLNGSSESSASKSIRPDVSNRNGQELSSGRPKTQVKNLLDAVNKRTGI